jgi:transglutaminase-like putative cysteine protease
MQDNQSLIEFMDFNTYFRASSYATVAVSMLALAVAGGLNLFLALGFGLLLVLAWKMEDTRWQLSERMGLLIVLLSIPLFFLDWHFQKALGESAARLGVNALAHLIVFLSAIKLLQVKSDRDWVFLYLISFFEVLLAAGLSFSPLFLGTLTLYLLCSLSTVIAFEIRKSMRAVKFVETRLLVPPDSSAFKRLARQRGKAKLAANRLPFTAFGLLCLIFVLALPLFLVAPRASSPVLSRGGSTLSTFIGFSESVTLGDIGTLKQNDQVVMRVRLDSSEATGVQGLRWRGIALDEFNGRSWRKSEAARNTQQRPNDRGSFRIGVTTEPYRLITQQVFLEPLETGVLFAAPQPVLIQAEFPFVRVDAEGSVQFRPHEADRLTYRAVSDMTEPAPETLRRDERQIPQAYERYLQTPEALDPRISELARTILIKTQVHNRYDAAAAIEAHLRNRYGYTLERKASGSDPLADFLFNVQTGHCEYFSTAMAIMLRTRGVPARVVNGFLPGEYNEAADAYTVRQSDAHSWVEVYFPETNSWVTFDPTPPAGRGAATRSGVTGWLSKYAEAMELVWFQYVVGYDKQEQRSLATSLHNGLFQLQRRLSDTFYRWQNTVRSGWRQPAILILSILLIALLVTLAVRVKRLGWRGLKFYRREREVELSPIEFYRRLLRILSARGISRSADQTPLEFATQAGLEVPLRITHAYHRVRYGAQGLSPGEAKEIDGWLTEMERETP